VPTPEALTCVNFQYGIGNSNGFTADEIFNEINNTLKTGLIIATRNVTIETLNSTMPREDSRRLWPEDHEPSHVPSKSSVVHSFVVMSPNDLYHSHNQLDSLSSRAALDPNLGPSIPSNDHTKRRRRAAYLPQAPYIDANDEAAERRRLAYYTDEYAPVINSIVDNQFCQKGDSFQCAVVDSTVCVILEEGDDEEEVRMALLNGIGQAISDGSFYEAVPPENRLPGGEAIDTI
jgi:hypothetical protein